MIDEEGVGGDDDVRVDLGMRHCLISRSEEPLKRRICWRIGAAGTVSSFPDLSPSASPSTRLGGKRGIERGSIARQSTPLLCPFNV